MSLTRKLIYASGAIAAATYTGATSWYYDAEAYLGEGFEIVRPMRGKSFLAATKGLLGTDGYSSSNSYEAALVSPRGIYQRDRHDVARCDAVLMFLVGQTTPSLGCACEAAWAESFGKPVIMIAEPENVHRRHPILGSIPAYVVDNLHDGCDLICGLFGS